jgi:hypothetical protein
MSNWSLKIQSGSFQSTTGNHVQYDDVSHNLYQTNAPVSGTDLVNKDYSDGFLGTKLISIPTVDKTVYVYNLGFDNWDSANTLDPIWNAIQFNSVPLSGTVSDLQAYVYNLGSTQFETSDIVNSVNNSTAGMNPIVSVGPTGHVYMANIASNDNSILLANDVITPGDQTTAFLDITVNPAIIPSITGSYKQIDSNVTPGTIGNSTTETSMFSFSIPGNTLTTNGQSVEYVLEGNYQSTASNLTIKSYFAGQLCTTVPTAGLLGNSGSTIKLVVTATRTSSGNASVFTEIETGDATSITTNALKWPNRGSLSGVDFTNAITIETTAATGAAGTISYHNARLAVQGIS